MEKETIRTKLDQNSNRLITYRLSWSLIITFLLIACNSHSLKISGVVTSVKDGDTIEILYNKRPYRIRLNGIDCPEKSQAFGNRAKQYTSELCYRKLVTANITDTDRYGRYLADIVLPSGRILNEELLKAGLAWHYKQYSKSKRLAELERLSRKARRGLWSQKDPIPPWKFRRK